MLINCRNCRFFRPYRPLSQLLARELGLNDTQIVSQLISIMQDEYRVKGNEAQKRTELMIKGETKWDQKPAMSDYCGFEESKLIYLLYEMKNTDGKCLDYQELAGARKECTTCQHRIPADGEAKDRQMIEQYKQIEVNSASLGQGGNQGLVTNYIQRIGVVMTFEAAQCYYSRKLTYQKPNYLQTCGLYSTDKDFVPCIVQNPYEVCGDWTSVAKGAKLAEQDESGDSIIKELENFRKSTFHPPQKR